MDEPDKKLINRMLKEDIEGDLSYKSTSRSGYRKGRAQINK